LKKELLLDYILNALELAIQGENLLAEKHRLDSKPEIDSLFRQIKKNDWEATDFIFKNCWNYCRNIYFKRNWHINEEDLKSIINFSIGKAIAKYEICGKYWGLLGTIFAHEVYEILRPIYGEKGMGRKVDQISVDFGCGDPQFSRSDAALLLEKALSMKPEEHRICIQLELEGYTDEQIKVLMITTKSVKDLKHHAKLNLKKVLIEQFSWKPGKD
jgi:hypothetical protein